MNFEIGKTYEVILNGKIRSMKVIQKYSILFEGPKHYLIRWDDGDDEFASPIDMERWYYDLLENRNR